MAHLLLKESQVTRTTQLAEDRKPKKVKAMEFGKSNKSSKE
jgi:hypothetical protein